MSIKLNKLLQEFNPDYVLYGGEKRLFLPLKKCEVSQIFENLINTQLHNYFTLISLGSEIVFQPPLLFLVFYLVLYPSI